jgi:hypothetical protein
MACLIDPIGQLSLDILPICIPLFSDEVTNSKRCYEMTDSSQVSYV